MPEDNDSLEAARYRLFRERPGLGALLLLASIIIPALISLTLVWLGRDFFFADLAGRFFLALMIGTVVGTSIWITQRIRLRLLKEAASSLGDPSTN